MHRFDRMHLSPEEALNRLDTVDLEEKSRVAEGIALIAVIDHRRDFLAAGYSCMRDYCMSRLHMSEDQAFRRIQVARVALQFPQVFECLADGRLSLATASVLAPHLKPETAAELFTTSAFQSRDEILRRIAERSRPVVAPPNGIDGAPTVESSSGSLAPGQVSELSDLCAAPPQDHGAPAQAATNVDSPRRGRVFTSTSGAHEVRLTLTDEEHDDLRQAQDLLGHVVPSGDPAIVYARAMKHYVVHLEKRRFGARRNTAAAQAGSTSDTEASAHADAPSCGRNIPRELRRLVWERDGRRCTFVGTGGHRCEATRRLELDHITPVAQGGRTEPANLRLLCRAHNQFEAERVLGKDHMQGKRELAQRGRGRARAAAAAAAARAKERDPARQARRDDLVGALRGLGFKVADANAGADLADEMPDASLETCLRHALTVLTRPTVARGERRARCSA